MLSGFEKAGFDSTYYADYMVADVYQLKRIFLATGFIGFIMVLYKYNIASGLFKIIAKVGQMSLTNYIMQTARLHPALLRLRTEIIRVAGALSTVLYPGRYLGFPDHLQ